MIAAGPRSILANHLAELLMKNLAPCDLGDGVEVVHDVEDAVEIEMDCDLDDAVDLSPDDIEASVNSWFDKFWVDPNDDVMKTATFPRELDADDFGTQKFPREDDGTHQFVRDSAPYERIEIQIDASSFVRATIADAMTSLRARDSAADAQL